MRKDVPVTTPHATIVGIKAVRATLGAMRSKLEVIRSTLADDGTGYFVTPDGLDENDIPIYETVIATLEAACVRSK